MKCAFCQHDIPDGSRFCPSCGAPVTAAAAPGTRSSHDPGAPPSPIPARPAVPVPPPKRGRSLWLFGCLGVGVLVVLCIVALVVARGLLKDEGASSGQAGITAAPIASAAPKATAKPSGKAAATVRPTAVDLEPPLPDVLKPLILSGSHPAKDVRYRVTLDGDWSYAMLSYFVEGDTVRLPNLAGTSSWSISFFFYPSEDRAHRGAESLVDGIRHPTNADSTYVGAAESSPGKGDESYLFTKPDSNQPQYATRSYVVRQGKTTFLLVTVGDVKNPVVPGDGIDTLVAALKTIDNAALFAAARP